MTYCAGSSVDTIWNTHGTLGWQYCKHNTELTFTVHNLLTQHPILTVYEAHTIQCKKYMIHHTDNIHNIRHTMLDLNNSCDTLMVYNSYITENTTPYRNSQYIHRQHNTKDEEHNITQDTCRAGCTIAVMQT